MASSTITSWLDFFRSLVITRLYPLCLVEDTADITSQLLSSLSKIRNYYFFFSLASGLKLTTLNII